MKLKPKPPFTEYTCYKVYHKRMNRWQVCLVHRTGYRRTILLSKFLMSIKLGRWLMPDEEVDHKDGDKTNDTLSNLEIVTQKENRKRYNMMNPAKQLEFTCPSCGSVFYRFKHRAYRSIHLGLPLYCSRSCGGKRK